MNPSSQISQNGAPCVSWTLGQNEVRRDQDKNPASLDTNTHIRTSNVKIKIINKDSIFGVEFHVIVIESITCNT